MAERRRRLTTGERAMWGLSAAAFLAFVSWLLGGSYLRERDAALNLASEAAVSGPPCPEVSAAEFAARGYKAPKRTNYEGVIFARQVGHMECRALRYGAGWGTDTYPVCAFTGPAALTVTVAGTTRYFIPGPGQPVTLAVPKDGPRCVMASNFTIAKIVAR